MAGRLGLELGLFASSSWNAGERGSSPRTPAGSCSAVRSRFRDRAASGRRSRCRRA
ncbi:MAG: hypothetical protein MZW92_08640 [Comamonadaceae bacterium]|nr:hypothetical protein [Comamonadaceae bacterium]